jgi:hypothetical protein
MNRGQAHTLEGVVAGLVLLSGLLFALQATAVTPLSASTSSQHLENQQQTSAEGVLATAAEEGTLKPAVLFWDGEAPDPINEFHDADNGEFYTSEAPPNGFGSILSQTFGGRGLAFNVYVVYQRQSDSRKVRQRMVYRGEPSDNAVTASRLVTIYDSDELHADGDDDGIAEPTGTVISASNFYALDTGTTSGVYNVAEVEVIVWRR